MKILTSDDNSFDINNVGGTFNEELTFSILDYSDPSDIDYFNLPLIFLENYERPSVDLQIGEHRLQIPLDWSVVIVDKHSGVVETIELKSINGREFDVWCLNPISGFAPEFLPIKIMNVFPNKEWFVPKLKNGHILVVPLETKQSPLCALFVRDSNKIPDQLDVSSLI